MLGHNVVHGGQPETIASDSFRAKKWFEDVCPRFLIHTATGIADTELDRCHPRAVSLAIGGSQSDLPAIRHGVARIDDKIEQ